MSYTLQELENIVDSASSFNEFIDGIDTLQGQTLDLILEVVKISYEVGGDGLSDEAMLTLILDIVDANRHYASTYTSEREGE